MGSPKKALHVSVWYLPTRFDKHLPHCCYHGNVPGVSAASHAVNKLRMAMSIWAVHTNSQSPSSLHCAAQLIVAKDEMLCAWICRQPC